MRTFVGPSKSLSSVTKSAWLPHAMLIILHHAQIPQSHRKRHIVSLLSFKFSNLIMHLWGADQATLVTAFV